MGVSREIRGVRVTMVENRVEKMAVRGGGIQWGEVGRVDVRVSRADLEGYKFKRLSQKMRSKRDRRKKERSSMGQGLNGWWA